ncbi:flagellar motor switching and energizing component [Sulfobacillus acidophilus TPY]|uniref:Flagellar motor switch protein FliG n=1 Tax=Sulfobacillus acidophilus (strain ATCC 700253 / DSM 10332 / NAL) TaxID=679936 RepID=G8U1J7_SULAD|nr:flagellar motor switching and energizing component [Sulfobacillus acidophilus TPY]AEW06602.1 flagellar motor switch protein FliG [Sulfobacillus acidophilus DSM 10332]
MEKMTGARKAAILLLTVGAEEAANILRYLGRTEVEAITVEIAKLKRVDPKLQEEILQEFFHLSQAERQIAEGGADLARQMLERAFDGQRAGEIMYRLRNFLQKRPFEILRKVDASQILQLVQGEHPQTIAVILSHTDPAVSAQVLSALPAEVQADVARRIAVMGRAAPEVIKDIESLIEQKLADLAADEAGGGGGLNIIVPILNNSERSAERQIMARLEEYDPELAESIRNRMFVFENIVQLDDRAVQKILRRVDNKTLAVALKGAPSDVSNKIFKNLSSKAAELLRDDIAVLGPVRIRDVENAQRDIVNIIRQLEDQGEIVISRGDQDDFVL